MPAKSAAPADGFVEEVELAGHIIDSLLLPKVLDLITGGGRRVPASSRSPSARPGTTPATP